MGYNNDPSRDEDGEPLMTFDDEEEEEEEDDPQEDRNPNPNFNEEDDDDVANDDGWRRQERSPTPVYNDNDGKKPRKRLVKRGRENEEREREDDDVAGLDLEDDDVAGFGDEEEEDDDVAEGGKRKKYGRVGAEEGGERRRREKKKVVRREKGKGGFSGDEEVNEMWDTVAGADSEDDQNGDRTLDDDNFIDDTGVDPADRYGSDNEPRSPSNAPQAEEGEEDDEIQRLFKQGKKKKKSEKSAGEIALLVEKVMAELEVVAEEDARLNEQSKPAINKLIKLPFLTDVLSKKQLQQEFLDHGVLSLLKSWLEPLPDGSLPNINVREAILRILTDFPIDLDQHDRKEQLKRSGLGKVIMFLSKTDEETTSNKKLAKDLVDKWSRPIFNKSTRFEDMRSYEDERAPSRRPSVKKPMNKASGMQSRDDDMDLSEYSQGKKSGQSSSRGLTTRPEAMALDFLVRPQSKIDPDEVRARAKQIVQDQRRVKMQKKLTQLKAPKKKQLQATKLSVEGRGMVKYL